MTLNRLRNAFWILFLPGSLVWALATKLRRHLFPRSFRYIPEIPSICVGNLHSGGTGKTPVVLEIAAHMAALVPAILSRGYGGAFAHKGTQVDPCASDGPSLYGDEPFMLARSLHCPVFIHKRRAAGARQIAHDAKSGLLILDDGFQHLAIKCRVQLVIIPANLSPRSSFCLPLGDLREPLSALRQASAIIIISDPENQGVSQWSAYLESLSLGAPIFVAHREFRGFWKHDDPFMPSSDTRFIAFCGIAGPSRFHSDLERAAAPVEFLKTFPDHHRYQESDLDFLIEKKRELNANVFLTTEKDREKVESKLAKRKEDLVVFRMGVKLPSGFWLWLDDRLRSI